MKGLNALITPGLERLRIFESVQSTHDVLEQKVNWLLNRCDSKETDHIDAKEKDKIKDESMKELRKFKEIVKQSLAHDWSTEFKADVKKFQED